jgi:transposase
LRVVGLDVSKSSVSACLLLEKPTEPRQFYFDCRFKRFHADAAGISELLALKPDVAVMEPTGINYQKLWGTHLARAGIPVYLVGHSELKAYRKYLGFLDNKDDDADALALACYYFDYHQSPKRFIQIRDFPITRIRELVLRLAHLNRVQSPIINRLRQDLAWQFPEVALVNSRRQQLSGNLPLLWAWLAGEKKAIKYDRLLDKSVGLGITSTVRLHAQRICHLQQEEIAIERELTQLLEAFEFRPYRKVFAEFGFGLRLQSVLLSQIYPLSNYFDKNGNPEVIERRGRKSGKPTKRYLSERRFMRSLGVAPGKDASGDKELDRVGGSDLCRIALWQWVFTRIEPKRSRPKNDIGKQLGEMMDAEKSAGRPIKLVRTRVAARAVRLLFKRLVWALRSI